MKNLDNQLLWQALQDTGESLRQQFPSESFTILLVGGSAGMLAGLLNPSRTTADCDVMAVTPTHAWEQIEIAAREVAHSLNLPETWLNRECTHYAWCMPLGWKDRCSLVHRFGSLTVLHLSRRDLIASKIISAPHRPQDLEDLEEIQPKNDELDFAAENLNRLESESLDDRSWQDEHAILESFRGAS